MRLAALEADKRLLDAIDLAKKLKAAQCQLRDLKRKRIEEKGMHITIHPLRDNFIAPRYKTKGAAAFDLYLQDDLYLTPGEPVKSAWDLPQTLRTATVSRLSRAPRPA